MNNKPKVFMIMPFTEDFEDLYEELKNRFENDFEFSHAADLDNQRNILQDIVVGISEAHVIIADVTGLNANVFYELGLAHAMNKKVIIITQDINDLPFDIRSYRANEYSLKFNKFPKLVEEIKKLLFGAIDGSVIYGSPVTDYFPVINTPNDVDEVRVDKEKTNNIDTEDKPTTEYEEKGFIDNLADIEENTQKMVVELNSISEEMNEMNTSITSATNDINRAKLQSKNADAIFIRNICRKLSEPVELFAQKLKGHTEEITTFWSVVENSYLCLLDNNFIRNKENALSIKQKLSELETMKDAIISTDGKISGFADVLRGTVGIERRLNKAITTLVQELEGYLTMTGAMVSSVDRIITKGEIFMNSIEND